MNYDDIFTFENLYKAHLKSRLSKRNKKEVVDFELNTGSNLMKLFYELKSRKYRILDYNTFYVYEPKRRRVDAIRYRDRVVQHCFCDNYLTPFLEKRLIYDNAATRKDKGTDFARKRLKYFYSEFYNKHKNNNGYVLKCDVHHFFESIDHEILKSIIKSKIVHEDIRSFIFAIIDSYNCKERKGLPIGNQTSQAFAILYLDEMDRIIKEKMRVKHYIRYMDDFVLLSDSKIELKDIMKRLEIYLNGKRKLSLNKKTRIYKISESVEFLGFHFKMFENGKIIMKLNSTKCVSINEKINLKIRDFKNKRIDITEFKLSMSSFFGHVEKGNNYYFKKRLMEKVGSMNNSDSQ